MSESLKQKIQMELDVTGAGKAGAELKGLESASGGLAGIMGAIPPQALAIAAAVTAIVAPTILATKYLVENTEAMAAWGASMFNSATMAQTSVEEYQSLNYVLRQTTGQLDGAGASLRAITTFLASASTGTGRQAEALDQLNLNYEDMIKLDPAERYNVITDAIGAMTDVTQKQIIASNIFGSRYSTAVVAALDQAGGSMRGMMDTFRESNLIMGTDSVNALKKYDDAITDYQMGMDILKGDLAVGFLPVMENVLEAFQEVLPALREGIAKVLPVVVERGLEFTDWAEGAIPHIINFIEGMGDFADGAEKTWQELVPVVELLQEFIKFISPLEEIIVDLTFKPLIEGLTGTLGILTDTIEFMEKHEDSVRIFTGIMTGGMSEITRLVLENKESTDVLDEALERLSDTYHDVMVMVRSMYEAQVLSNQATRDAEEASITAQIAYDRLTRQTGELTANTLGLSIEMVNLDLVANSLSIGMATADAIMGGMTPEIQAKIDVLQTYRTTLLDLQGALLTPSDTGGGFGTPTTEPIDKGDSMGGGIKPVDDEWKKGQSLSKEEQAQRLMEIQTFLEAQNSLGKEMRTLQKEEELADWQERYDIAMDYSGQIVNTFVNSWDGGFDQLGENFKKMVEQMVKDMIASGLLSLIGNIIAPGSGGATKVVGKLGGFIGKGGK